MDMSDHLITHWYWYISVFLVVGSMGIVFVNLSKQKNSLFLGLIGVLLAVIGFVFCLFGSAGIFLWMILYSVPLIESLVKEHINICWIVVGIIGIVAVVLVGYFAKGKAL